MEDLNTKPISETVKKLPEPLKTIPQSVRNEIVNGGRRLRKTLEPKPSPWRKVFEMLGVGIIVAGIALKALGKKTEK